MRHALRLLMRTPGASALVLTIPTLAVATNVTLFSVLDAALFRGVSLPHSDRLVNIYTLGSRGSGYGGLSLPDFRDVSDALVTSADVFGYSGLMAAATIEAASPQVVFGEMVTANYFAASGAPLVLGTGFTAADDYAGETPRVVLGHRPRDDRPAGAIRFDRPRAWIDCQRGRGACVERLPVWNGAARSRHVDLGAGVRRRRDGTCDSARRAPRDDDRSRAC